MNISWPKLKLDKANDGGSGGGIPKPPIPTPTPPTPAPATNTPATQTPGSDDHLDDLGYEIIPDEVPQEGEANPPAPAKAAAVQPDPVTIKDSATGYGDEPQAVVDTPAAAVTPAAATPPATPDDIDKALAGLPDLEAKKIKDFATKNKITPEVAKEYAELRKTELKEAQEHFDKTQKEFDTERLRTRAQWHKELKDDPTFGGEKFAKNIHNVDRVLTEFMPGLKKSLTDRKAMLPPNVMRDFAKLGDHLYGNDRLVVGEQPAPLTPKTDASDDPLAFYE